MIKEEGEEPKRCSDQPQVYNKFSYIWLADSRFTTFYEKLVQASRGKFQDLSPFTTENAFLTD